MKEKIIPLLDKLTDRQLNKLYTELHQVTCSHNTIINKKNSAFCKECNQDMGWYCPNSPDHLCYYFSKKDNIGHFLTIKKQRYDLPADYSDKFETDDYCIFCHEPEERK